MNRFASQKYREYPMSSLDPTTSSSSSQPPLLQKSSLHRLLWQEDAVREMFQNKLWPEYVGNETRVRYYYDREVSATLPVILWDAQMPIYDETQSKKRKLELEATSDDVVENIELDRVVEPSRPLDIRSQIFKELHNKGYFVGPGDIYGGDYGLYKNGDPSNSHSVATVRLVLPRISRHSSILSHISANPDKHTNVIDKQSSNLNESTQDEDTNVEVSKSQSAELESNAMSDPSPEVNTTCRPTISAKEFLAFSRVQNHVAKNTVLAFHNPDTQQIGFLVSNFLYVSDRLA